MDLKRLFLAAILAAVWALSGAAWAEGPVLVEAEATEAPVFSVAEAPYEGIWQPFEDGFQLYLPLGWSAIDVTDNQAEAGLFYRAGSGDGTTGIAVGYMNARGLDTVEALARDFQQTGYSAGATGWLNGIPAIRFERPEDGYRGVAFFHPVYPDYVLYIYLSPRDSVEGAALLASVTPLPGFAGQVKNN